MVNITLFVTATVLAFSVKVNLCFSTLYCSILFLE